MLWPEHRMRPAGGRVYNTRHHVHIIEIVFLRVGFLRGLGVPSREKQPSYGAAETPPIRKSRSISADVEMGFSKCIYGDTGMGILLFASPHPRMQGLTTSSQLEHKLYFISQSSSRKRREREKKKNQSS